MKLTNQGLRKAAILVSSLDTAAADKVLDQLTPEQAQQVRMLVVDLGDINRGEQQRVIDEFFRVGPMIPPKCPPGIELDGRLASLGITMDDAESEEPRQHRQAEGGSLQFLKEAETEKLARVLAEERPQTIALVLSRLPAARAGSVLSKLRPILQVEVIRRLVDLEETDPEILREVEEAIQARLSKQVQMQRRRVAGLKAVTSILEASDGRTGMQILDTLSAYDQPLADKLDARTLEFDDLADMDDELLARIFKAAGQALMIPALLGSPPRMVERLLAQWPADQGDAIRRQLEHPGPIRLRDVEEARRQIARLARRMTYRTAATTR